MTTTEDTSPGLGTSANGGPPDTGRRRTPAAPTREMVSSAATALAFVLIFGAYAVWLQDGFYDVTRLSFNISRSAPQLVLAVAVTACLCGHQFDLSVAAIATAGCFMVVGLFIDAGVPMGWAFAATVVVGAVAGAVNGFLVTALRVSPFIATLGTGGLFAGFTVVYSSGRVIGPTPESGRLPSWFSGAGSLGDFQNKVPTVLAVAAIIVVVLALLISIDQRFPGPEGRRRLQVTLLAGLGVAIVAGAAALGVPGQLDWTILVLVILTMIVWAVMKYTVAGHAVYAVGGNENAASFAGIRTQRVRFFLFVFSGSAAALAGVLIATQQGSAAPGVADPLLLPAYAGAFLSTVILSRGRFHIWGAVGGSIALVFVTDGLVVGGVPYTWTQVINGVVLIVAVALSTFLTRRAGS